MSSLRSLPAHNVSIPMFAQGIRPIGKIVSQSVTKKAQCRGARVSRRIIGFPVTETLQPQVCAADPAGGRTQAARRLCHSADGDCFGLPPSLSSVRSFWLNATDSTPGSFSSFSNSSAGISQVKRNGSIRARTVMLAGV